MMFVKASFRTRLGLLILVTVSCCAFVAFLNINLASQFSTGSSPYTVPDALNSYKNNKVAQFKFDATSKSNLEMKTETTKSFLNIFFIHNEWLKGSVKTNTNDKVPNDRANNAVVNYVMYPVLYNRSDVYRARNNTNNTVGHLLDNDKGKERNKSVNKMLKLIQTLEVLSNSKRRNMSDQKSDLLTTTPFDGVDEEQRKAASYSYRKHIYHQLYRKMINQGGVDCPAIIQGDPAEKDRARKVMQRHARKAVSIEKYGRVTNCNNFKRTRGYINDPLSDTERNFPLAFSLIVYRDVEQIERLLRAIYRPHNFYCIHVDTKMNTKEQKALHTIASCFDNVFIASRSINVTWGEYTVLEAELICMEDLLQRKGWKYFINLTGQEYPLKTNREIVNILKVLNGENIVDGAIIRASQKYFYRWTNAGGPPPHGIRPFKGAVHVAVNRGFVDYCLNNDTAQDLLRWLRKTDISDESFFASLNYNAHLLAPGGFTGVPEEVPRKPAFTRYKRWRPSNNTGIRECYGKYVHDVCVLGVGDISRAYRNIALFVNKFYLDFEYLALDCLEEILYKKTWQEYLHDAQINVTINRSLDEVTYLLKHTYGN